MFAFCRDLFALEIRNSIDPGVEAGLLVNMEIYLSLSLAAHFSQICSRFSALNLLATAKRSRNGKGLHASISMRLIVKSPFSRFSGGRRGSRSLVQDLRICTDSAGSTRVHIAQITCFRSTGSMSSS